MQQRLVVFFGPPGVGKSFIGQLIAREYGLRVYEADQDITPAMKACYRRHQRITHQVRRGYYQSIIKKTKQLHCDVVVQAFHKDFARRLFRKAFPNSKFILVRAPKRTHIKHLKSRKGHPLPIDVALKIAQDFEKPSFSYRVLTNKEGIKELKPKLAKLLPH